MLHVKGKSPFISAWGFKQKTKSTRPLLRPSLKGGGGNILPFLDWWFSDQIVFFGIWKRWNGSAWITHSTPIKVRNF